MGLPESSIGFVFRPAEAEKNDSDKDHRRTCEHETIHLCEKKKYESTMAVNGSTVSSTPVMVGRILEALTM